MYNGATMQIDIHAKTLELNAPLRTFIEEKTADLEHLLGTMGEAHIKWEVGLTSKHHQSGPIYYAEANISLTGGPLLRAESTNYDLHAAIVDVKDELKVQIKKFKERLTDVARQPVQE
jgi:ribosomal subunit interface protein